MPSAANKASAFRGLLRFKRSRSSMYRAPRFERGGCRRESCWEYQFTGMWLDPNSRVQTQNRQPWGCNSLHAHQPSFEAQQEKGCRAVARSAQAGANVHTGELRPGKPFPGAWPQREQQTPAT